MLTTGWSRRDSPSGSIATPIDVPVSRAMRTASARLLGNGSIPGSQMGEGSNAGVARSTTAAKSTRESTAASGVIAASRSISAGVAPKPARSTRWAARS